VCFHLHLQFLPLFEVLAIESLFVFDSVPGAIQLELPIGPLSDVPVLAELEVVNDASEFLLRHGPVVLPVRQLTLVQLLLEDLLRGDAHLV